MFPRWAIWTPVGRVTNIFSFTKDVNNQEVKGMKQVLHLTVQQFVWDKMLIIMEYFVDSFTCEECKFWNTRTLLKPVRRNSNPPMSTAKLLVGTWQTSTSWTWSLTHKISGPVYVINKINICNYLVDEFDLWHARAPVSVTCTCTWLSSSRNLPKDRRVCMQCSITVIVNLQVVVWWIFHTCLKHFSLIVLERAILTALSTTFGNISNVESFRNKLSIKS